MLEMIIERIETLLSPLGIVGEVGAIIETVKNSIGIQLFTTLLALLMSLIIARILMKVL